MYNRYFNKLFKTITIGFKLFLFKYLLIIPVAIYAQKIKFRGDLVDTVKICSNKSYFHFDSLGTCTGEKFELTIAIKNNGKKINFITNEIKFRSTFEPYFYEENLKTTHPNLSITRKNILKLLKTFNEKKDLNKFEDLGITVNEFKIFTNKLAIQNFIESHNYVIAYNLLAEESKSKLIEQCNNIDTFKSFLNTKLTKSRDLNVSDVDQSFNIKIITKNKHFEFSSNYPNLYLQPWVEDNDTVDSKYILNFQINKALITILPDSFLEKNSLKLDALIDSYLDWCIVRYMNLD